MKNSKLLWTSGLILVAGISIPVIATSCSLVDLFKGNKSSNSYKQEEFTHGKLKSNLDYNVSTAYLNKRSIALKFTIPLNNNQAINIFGTGWIFDFQEDPITENIKTYYLATNIHVINLISAAKQNVSLALGQYDLASQSQDTRAFFNESLSFKSAKKTDNPQNYVNHNRVGTFSILPVGLKNQLKNYGVQNPTALASLNNLTSAVDLAIVKITRDILQKNNIDALRNFDKEVGIGFGNTISHHQRFYAAGYPHDEKYSRWNQYSNQPNQLFNSFTTSNYRKDNPINFSYNEAYMTVNNRNTIGKNSPTKYEAYDYATKDFDLHSGASGSPIIDDNNNYVGIYWGGFKIQEGLRTTFYGNFSPLFVNNKENGLSQDLLAYYLAYTSNETTYLDTNFNTNLRYSALSKENKAIYDEFVEYLEKQFLSDSKYGDKNTLSLKTVDGYSKGKQDLIKTLYNFIFNDINSPSFNEKYTHKSLKLEDIIDVKVEWNRKKNIDLRITFVTKKPLNFNVNHIVNFNTSFTFFKEIKQPNENDNLIDQLF